MSYLSESCFVYNFWLKDPGMQLDEPNKAKALKCKTEDRKKKNKQKQRLKTGSESELLSQPYEPLGTWKTDDIIIFIL